MSECVNRLLTSPPRDHLNAVNIFGYFACRVTELGDASLLKLRNAPIVPVTRTIPSKSSDKPTTSVSYISPSRVYLGASSTYGDIFDFVDLGKDANTFLMRCGAKVEPTKLEVAHMACTEPARLLSVMKSPEKYLDLLKSLAEVTPNLRRDKELWYKMRSASFLLAYKELSASKEKALDHEEDDAPVRQYQLSSAGRIVVLDDIISYRLFKDHLLCAPEEDILEEFYMALGAQKLSSVVQEDIRIGPHSTSQARAESLRKHVIERSKIFLYEYTSYRRDAVKHDSKWLEKNLKVEMVRSVALRRSLKGQTQSHTEKRSAASAQKGGTYVLYVVDELKNDMYQIGQAICQMLLNRPSQQAYLFFEPFLTLDLYGLRARGYNVDRILRAKAAEARIAEEERRKAMEEEQRKIQEREKKWGQAQAAEAARQTASIPEQSRTPMPGGWDLPEDTKPTLPQPPRRNKGLFYDLTRRLGFSTDDQGQGSAQKQLEQFLDKPAEAGPSSTGGSAHQPKKDDGRVTNPALVQQNLLNAIQSTRPHGSDAVFNEPKTNEVKEQATYCDKTPAHNIAFAAEASNGMKVYVAKDLAAEPSKFLITNIGPINAFASLLVEIGSIYALSPQVLHIFYDEAGGTIAFNTGGSIFCNLRWFLQLHAKNLEGPRQGEAKAEAGTWWWVVLAHELAHNLVSTHDADHSYYT